MAEKPMNVYLISPLEQEFLTADIVVIRALGRTHDARPLDLVVFERSTNFPGAVAWCFRENVSTDTLDGSESPLRLFKNGLLEGDYSAFKNVAYVSAPRSERDELENTARELARYELLAEIRLVS